MHKKKSPQANLENKRAAFLQTGFVAALALALAAFTWTTYDLDSRGVDPDSGLNILVLEDDIVPIHIPKRPEVEKKQPVVIDKIKIVENDPIEAEPNKDEPKEPDFDFDFTDYGVDDEVPDIIISGNNGPMNFMAVEQKPYYKDCEDVLDPVAEMQCTHIKVLRMVSSSARYPNRPKEMGIEGTVVVGFVINKKGEVTDLEVLESVHPDLDKEAVRAVSNLPNFIPGSQQGRNVSVSYRIPVTFRMK
jgi:protein TonB